MSFYVVVPARYASSRLPGKPLADLAGRPMVARVAERCAKSGATRVLVATDDERVRDAVGDQCEVVMTRADHPSGTDRLQEVAEQLGLAIEPVSTQVIPRDRHAMFFSTLAVIAGSIERLAVEIRHLQRTEVLEAEEYFSPGQKGSSAMPHKRNPILTENLTGQARMIRAYALPALENVALWHERDISHSSVERFIGPDACITLDFALARLTGVVDKLLVYPERMQANMDRMGGLIHSQRVLLALTQNGVSREDAYAIVQRNAMKVWESDGRLQLLDLLKQDEDVSKALSENDLTALFDLDYHLKHVDTIFARVFDGD